MKNINSQGNPRQGQQNGRNTHQRKPVPPPQHHGDQHPDGSGILKRNCNSYCSFFDCQVIEVVGASQAECSGERAKQKIATANAEKTWTIAKNQENPEHRNGEGSPGLGQDEGRDSCVRGKDAGVENGFAHGGSGAPAKSGSSYKEVPPPGMRQLAAAGADLLFSGASRQATGPAGQDQIQS